jgi:hypothetical protein
MKVGQYLHSDGGERREEKVLNFSSICGNLLNLSMLYRLTEGICQELLMIKLKVHRKCFLVRLDEADDTVVEECVGVGGVGEVQMIELCIGNTELSGEIAELSGEFIHVLYSCHPVVVGVVEEDGSGDGL